MTQALESHRPASKYGLIIKSGLLSGCIGALLSFLGVFIIIVISNSIGVDGLLLTQPVLASAAVVSGVSINYIFTRAFSEPVEERPNLNITIVKALVVTSIFLSITFSLILISLFVSWRDYFYFYVMGYSVGMAFVFTIIPGVLTRRLVT